MLNVFRPLVYFKLFQNFSVLSLCSKTICHESCTLKFSKSII